MWFVPQVNWAGVTVTEGGNIRITEKYMKKLDELLKITPTKSGDVSSMYGVLF